MMKGYSGIKIFAEIIIYYLKEKNSPSAKVTRVGEGGTLFDYFNSLNLRYQ